MCIVMHMQGSLQDRGLIVFYVVPRPVIYHIVTGLRVTSSFSSRSKLLEAGWFMMAREHSWSHLGFFCLFHFHLVPFWFFSVSEDFRLILLSSPLWGLYKNTRENAIFYPTTSRLLFLYYLATIETAPEVCARWKQGWCVGFCAQQRKEYLGGKSVCLLFVFWRKPQRTPHFDFLSRLLEHINISASSCTGP